MNKSLLVSIFSIILIINAYGMEQNSSSYTSDESTEFLDAAKDGSLERIKALLEVGADINAQDQWGRTALYYATKYGHKEVVKILLNRNADSNIQDQSGVSCLMCAAERNCKELAALLIARGAHINAHDKYRNSVLSYATKNNHSGMAQFLNLCNTEHVQAYLKDPQHTLMLISLRALSQQSLCLHASLGIVRL